MYVYLFKRLITLTSRSSSLYFVKQQMGLVGDNVTSLKMPLANTQRPMTNTTGLMVVGFIDADFLNFFFFCFLPVDIPIND